MCRVNFLQAGARRIWAVDTVAGDLACCYLRWCGRRRFSLVLVRCGPASGRVGTQMHHIVVSGACKDAMLPEPYLKRVAGMWSIAACSRRPDAIMTAAAILMPMMQCSTLVHRLYRKTEAIPGIANRISREHWPGFSWPLRSGALPASQYVPGSAGENGLLSHPWIKRWREVSPLDSCQRLTPTFLLQHYGDLGGFNYPINTDRRVVQRLFNVVRISCLYGRSTAKLSVQA